MAVLHTQLQPNNPFRAPAWRWEYINRLQSHRPLKLPIHRRDDYWVHLAWHFFRRWSRFANNDQRIDRLFPTIPGLFIATMCYLNEDRELRDILEACLLARMSDERIAAKLGTLCDTAYWYEKIFFDVRERLDNRHYILKAIQGRAGDRAANREGSSTAFQKALVIKKFAYFGGEHVLDLVLTGFANVAPPRRSADARQWAEDAIKTAIARRALVGAADFDTNKSDDIQHLELAQKMIQQEQQIRGTDLAICDIERNIQKAGELIKVQMGGRQRQEDQYAANGRATASGSGWYAVAKRRTQ
jgi:hypothetical protein